MVGADTLRRLWDQYLNSSAWGSLARATQRQRFNIMSHVLESAGDMPFSSITRQHIIDGRERRKATPSQANNFLGVMRALFAWAKDAELIEDDPTENVKIVKRPNTGGFPDWSRDDVAAFERRWPIGTRERLALEILLTTGLRRGDAARLGKQHFRGGEIFLRAEKNDAELTIPVAASLHRAILATKTGDLALIATESGRPMVKEGFGNWFGGAARAAGVKKNAHGLRKLAATIVAENGASEAQLMALFGWTDPAMARLYTRKANRARLAREAAAKFERNESSTSIPLPSQKVRD
jgi:integrase